MIDPKVVEYIKSETVKGVSRDEIVKKLMQGGGWTLSDIQAHFLLSEQPSTTIPVGSIRNDQSNEIKNIQIQSKKKMNVFGVNLLIFACYYILGIILGGNSVGIGLVYSGPMLHAIILGILSIIDGVRGFLQKRKTNAGKYFLTAILILIIGFGACAIAFTGGLIDISL